MIDEKYELYRQGKKGEAKEKQQIIKRQLKRDKRRWMRNIVNDCLNCKDKWAGVKVLKKGFTPTRYARKD